MWFKKINKTTPPANLPTAAQTTIKRVCTALNREPTTIKEEPEEDEGEDAQEIKLGFTKESSKTVIIYKKNSKKTVCLRILFL
jgi:hypothetical protein